MIANLRNPGGKSETPRAEVSGEETRDVYEIRVNIAIIKNFVIKGVSFGQFGTTPFRLA
ncbi:hypothetical protein BpJC7_31020 [Weizmannia acidilactici]|uniref:Uncharacterized protein n=1 Tax=Weizmannia acidilactici TaxID=2607726 RepID=A0A5J4JKP5_9BACI|nr:hypothetical protein BpJC4_24570 [Weizmannia acidilactici]GER71799.1 hypothetical protein BpJC7_31020 [Weizmannia acidilactici]